MEHENCFACEDRGGSSNRDAVAFAVIDEEGEYEEEKVDLDLYHYRQYHYWNPRCYQNPQSHYHCATRLSYPIGNQMLIRFGRQMAQDQ